MIKEVENESRAAETKFHKSESKQKKNVLGKEEIGTTKASENLSATTDQVVFNRSNFQMRRVHKKPAIEESEMIDLKEKLKKTEENINRLQNWTHDETLNESISKDTEQCISRATYIMDVNTERKSHHRCTPMPVFIARKYEKYLFKMAKKSSVQKTPEEIEYDSSSVLMGDRPAQGAAGRERNRVGGPRVRPSPKGVDRSSSERNGLPERLSWPSSSCEGDSPPASTPSITPHNSDEFPANGVRGSSASLVDFSNSDPPGRTISESELSDFEKRPTSRMSDVLRCVQAATQHGDYSSVFDDYRCGKEGQRNKNKVNYGLGYISIIRGAMLQDRRAVGVLQSCVQDIQKLQKKMDKVRMHDTFTTLHQQLPQKKPSSTDNTIPSSPDYEINVQRTRSMLNDNAAKYFGREKTPKGTKQNEWLNSSTNNKQTPPKKRISLLKAKSDLLGMYGKAGVNTETLRKFGERTHWTF